MVELAGKSLDRQNQTDFARKRELFYFFNNIRMMLENI